MKSIITNFILVILLVLCNAVTSVCQESTDVINKLDLPQGFSAEIFYSDIPFPDCIAVRSDGTLLVVNERSGPVGVFVARKGDSFDVGDAYSTIGAPFGNPEAVMIYPDGNVYVTDSKIPARTVFKIPVEGAAPSVFASSANEGINTVFGACHLAIAPPSFNGPHVNPGDLIVCDAQGLTIWAINPSTGTAHAIVQGNVFPDYPFNVVFSPDGRLFVYEDYHKSGSSRIVCVDAEGKVTPFLSNIPDRGRMIVNPVTGDIFFGLRDNVKEIWRVPGKGGYPQIFASGFSQNSEIQDMQFSPDGKKLYVSAEQSIIEISGPFLEPIPESKYAFGSVAGFVTKTKDKAAYSDLVVAAYREDKLAGSAITDEKGQYNLMLLPGEYKVKAKRGQGMKSSDVSVLTVSAGQESKADLKAKPVELPEVMEKSMAVYNSLKGYRDSSTFEIHMTKPGLDNRISSQTLFAFETPNRILNKNIIESQIGRIDIFGNGEKMVSYMKRWKQYTEEDSPEMLNSADFQMLQSIVANNIILSDDPLKDLKNGVEEVKEAGSEQLDGKSTIVIELMQLASSLGSDLVPPTATEEMLTPVKLWIDSKDYLIRKIAFELDMEQLSKSLPEQQRASVGDAYKGMKMSITEMHKEIEIDPVFSDKDFTFVPPDGAQLVMNFSPPRPEASKLIGKLAPEFSLKDIEGNEVKLSDLKGKVVVTDFWATWCGPCIKAMPQIQALYEKYDKNSVVVLGINTWEREEGLVEPFLKEHKITYRTLVDKSGQVTKQYGVQGIPTLFVIDREGMVKHEHIGFSENLFEELSNEIEVLNN
ncbi:redoxin domain-containing protein [Candidatus Latescibacterota bacterium]